MTRIFLCSASLLCLLVLLPGLAPLCARAQAAAPAAPEIASLPQEPATGPATSLRETFAHFRPSLPALDTVAEAQPPASSSPLRPRPPETAAERAENVRISRLAIINGTPYDDPSEADIFRGYLKDTYGLTGIAGTTVRALYAQARGKPTGWGTDIAGFGQRFGSSAVITAINGTVRYGMEELFREDLRYLPCHGCSVKHKIENVLLAEITARHDVDGHRFFTITPTVADFSGPIIAHTLWYPGAAAGPLAGTVSARTVFATRIGTRLFQEFVLERRHKHPKETM